MAQRPGTPEGMNTVSLDDDSPAAKGRSAGEKSLRDLKRAVAKAQDDYAPQHNPDLRVALGYVSPYHIYQQQLEGHTFDRTDEISMRDLGILAVMYDRRWIYEDLASLSSFVTMVLVLVIEFHMFHWMDIHPHEIYHDDMFNIVLKWMVSGLCVITAILVTLRYKVVVNKMVLRNVLPKNTGLIVHADGGVLRSYLLEIFVMLLHVPPTWDFYITCYGQNTYRAHVNMINVLVFFKLYLFFRSMRNHSGFYGQHTNFIANLNGVDSMSVLFNFKMLLKYKPLTLLVPLFLVNTLGMASALVIVEHPDPDSPIRTFWDAVYVSVITMSTVGYGDYVPTTVFGRVVVILMGIIGGTLLLTLMVAVFVEVASCSPQEEQVINIVSRRKYNKKLREVAVRVLQLASKKYLLKKRLREHSGSAREDETKAALDEANKKMYSAVHDIRVIRKARPDDSTERDRDDKISSLVINVTKFLFGGVESKVQYKLDTPLDVALTKLIIRQHAMEKDLDQLVATLESTVKQIGNKG